MLPVEQWPMHWLNLPPQDAHTPRTTTGITGPGPYTYRDPIGSVETVQVLKEGGAWMVRFGGMQPGEELPAADLAGTFERR